MLFDMGRLPWAFSRKNWFCDMVLLILFSILRNCWKKMDLLKT
jgi:hypothetical protein